MAYEFKPLSGVEFTESIGENANMLVVDDGVVKQAPAASGGVVILYAGGFEGSVLCTDEAMENWISASELYELMGTNTVLVECTYEYETDWGGSTSTFRSPVLYHDLYGSTVYFCAGRDFDSESGEVKLKLGYAVIADGGEEGWG